SFHSHLRATLLASPSQVRRALRRFACLAQPNPGRRPCSSYEIPSRMKFRVRVDRSCRIDALPEIEAKMARRHLPSGTTIQLLSSNPAYQKENDKLLDN